MLPSLALATKNHSLWAMAEAPPPKISYRSAAATDRSAWATMRSELWPECPPARHELEVQQLLSSNALVVFATSGRELIGFAEVSIRVDHVEGTRNAPVPYLEGWYVRPNHRGLGIGRGLLGFVERWAMGCGFAELASDAEIGNAHSIRLHGELGFSEVGRSVHFVKRLGSATPTTP